jgi:CBS domain-containing protein
MLVSRFMTRNPTTVDPASSLIAAARIMEEQGFRHLPVQRNGELVGLISDRDVRLGTGTLTDQELDLLEGVPQRVEEVMRSPVICVESDERGPVAASRMIEQKVGALPVPEDGRLVGIVTETNLVGAFHGLCRDPATADTLDAMIEGVMHSMVVTMSPSDSVSEAIKACTDWRIRHIPVLDDEDELVGIVSDRDIRMAVGHAMVADARAQAAGRVYVEDQRVGDIMSSDVLTIEPTEMLSSAVPLMVENRVSALPVSIKGMLLGIITRTDVLEHYGSVA